MMQDTATAFAILLIALVALVGIFWLLVPKTPQRSRVRAAWKGELANNVLDALANRTFPIGHSVYEHGPLVSLSLPEDSAPACEPVEHRVRVEACDDASVAAASTNDDGRGWSDDSDSD